MEPEAPPGSQPVAISSVVRGLAEGGAVRITVHGAWRGAPAGDPPALVVRDAAGRHTVPAVRDEDAERPGAVLAVFDLPPALGGASGEALRLEVGGAELELPEALPGVPPAPVRDVTAEAPPEPAEVIDRAVLAELRARRAEQAQEELAERLRTLEAHLADVTAERDRLRDDLDAYAEGEERRVASLLDQIAKLRESAGRADALQAALAAAEGEAAELREERDGLRTALREEPAGEAPDPFDVALAGLRARTAPPEGDEADLRNTMDLAAMSPGRRARSRLRRVEPADRHVLAAESLARERRSGVTWLSEALATLAADDLRGAGHLLVSLLPDCGRTLEGEGMVFDVEVDHVGTFRVSLGAGGGTVVARRPGSEHDAQFRVSGSVAELAPLAAGGAPRRLRGARVSGSRRTLRRLLRSRREPVDLGDLAASGTVPDPSLLLRVLAAGVRPSWTRDAEYAVAIDVPEHEPITVVAEPGRRLQVTDAPPSGGAVRAVLSTSPPALLALLGRVAPPDDDDAWITGEEDVMTALLELLDRAQGLPSRA